MQIELSDKERQYVLNAIDSFVRQTGLLNAEMGLSVVKKLQTPKGGEEPGKGKG